MAKLSQLKESLNNFLVALELIAWLRDNDYLDDKMVETDEQLAEQFAFHLTFEKGTLEKLKNVLNRS